MSKEKIKRKGEYLYIIRLIFILMFLSFLTPCVLGYEDCGDIYTHTEINRQAILQFENEFMKSDPYLINASLDGNKTWGLAWDRASEGGPGDVIFPPNKRPDIFVQKSIKEWLLSGAYSADEPQAAMGLVHFYDPIAPEGEGYLTDQQFLVYLISQIYNRQWVNPKIDAVRWGLWDINLSDISGNVFIQEYSYADAHRNFIRALETKENNNEYYGKTWRAIGETMHLVADMTVPAHVRNDAHPSLLLDADPYEHSTTEADIIANAGGSPADINYFTDVETMMRSIANYTNLHYFSKDTIEGQVTSSTSYNSPSLQGLKLDNENYFHEIVNGEDTRIVHKSGSKLIFNWATARFEEKPVFEIDMNVINDQRKVLIPTAIRGGIAVLDRFLPRFNATMSYDYLDTNNPDSNIYIMQGKIKLADDAWNRDEWSNLSINNGAEIIFYHSNGSISNQMIDPNDVSTMNEFTYIFHAEKDDEVELIYDLGGYVVRAETIGMSDVNSSSII